MRPQDLDRVQPFVEVNGRVYAIGPFIDKGCYAEVRRAVDQADSDIPLVIKSTEPRVDLLPEIEFEKNFKVLVGWAKHPDTENWLRVMPYYGVSLFHRLEALDKQRGALTEEDCKKWLLGCAQQILDFHRGTLTENKETCLQGDIKPDNFLMDERGQIRLVDLGLTRVCKKGESVEVRDVLLDPKNPHAAPEIKKNPALYSFASDVYAFGVVIKFITAFTERGKLNNPRSKLNRLSNYFMQHKDPKCRPSMEWVYMILLACLCNNTRELITELRKYEFAPQDPWIARSLLYVLPVASQEGLALEGPELENYVKGLQKGAALICEALSYGDYDLAAYLLFHIEKFDDRAYRAFREYAWDLVSSLINFINSEQALDRELSAKILILLQKLNVLPAPNDGYIDKDLSNAFSSAMNNLRQAAIQYQKRLTAQQQAVEYLRYTTFFRCPQQIQSTDQACRQFSQFLSS